MRRLETLATIPPFGERCRDLSLLDRTLAEHQEAHAEAAGLGPRLTLAEHALATAPLLRAWAARASTTARPRRLALPDSHPLRLLTPVSTIERRGGALLYDVFLDAPPDASLEALRAEAEPLLVPLEGPTYRRELARLGPGPHHLDLPADGVVAAHVEHWVHALWVAPLLVPALLRAAPRFGPRAWRWPGSIVSPGATVHPTAVVEGSFIGPGASVGAGSAIRNSYVGAGARLSDFTKLERSVLGAGVHTLADATFSHVVSLGEGTLTNLLLRDVIVGRRVFLTSGVIFWADTLGEEIVVDHRGARHGTGRRTLGGAIGHGSVLGARTIVAPGVALPNRTIVVMRREEGVQRVAEVEPGTPLCWYDAGLVPFGELAGDGTPEEVRR